MDRISAVAERYLGALPARPAPRPLEEPHAVDCPTASRKVTLQVASDDRKGFVVMAWPAAAVEGDRALSRPFQLATRVFGRRLAQELREKRGLVYHADVETTLLGSGARACPAIAAGFAVDPANVRAAVASTREIALRLAREGMSTEELTVVDRESLTRLTKRYEVAAQWASLLEGLHTRNENLATFALTLEGKRPADLRVVNQLVQSILSQPDLEVIALPSTSLAEASKGATPAQR
ncbi:MAG TPA: insulinase family protein [Polyangia bacterium]